MTTEYYWLNKDSRKFLERGYLIEGETPEQRILDIANTAERYLGIDGFAKKFEGYMAKGFYSLSSPIPQRFRDRPGTPEKRSDLFPWKAFSLPLSQSHVRSSQPLVLRTQRASRNDG